MPIFPACMLNNHPAKLLDQDRMDLSDGAIFVTITDGVPGRMPNLRKICQHPKCLGIWLIMSVSCSSRQIRNY